MKSMKKLVLAGLILLASVVVFMGCDTQLEPEPEQTTVNEHVQEKPNTEQSGGSEQPSGTSGENDSVPEVTPAKRVSITVTPPTRTVYSVGEPFDSTGMVVTATYEDGETREVTGWTTNFDDVTSEKGVNKKVIVSYTEGDNTVTAPFTVDVASYQFTETVQDADSSYTGTMSGGTYKKFGDWPQTIMGAGVTVGSGTLVRGGLTYHVGSDGNYYVKVTADPYEDGYTYSDNSGVTEGSDVYFKVEPIVWRVLTESYNSTGKALLLAENILTGGIPYYVERNGRTIIGAGTKEGEPDTVYPNSYKYSTIRAWLNGKYEDDDIQEKNKAYEGKGFLQTAFTEKAQKEIIVDTEVDNSARSTNPDSNGERWNSGVNQYASETKTKDKIFLLSEQEVTMSDYGFAEYNAYGQGNTRIRVTTDYAKATGAYQSATAGSGGWWWLRSPNYSLENDARSIDYGGDASRNNGVSSIRVGVVPALSISINGN